GTITSTNGTAIYLRQNGRIDNLQGGTITGKFFGILVTGLPKGTITNAGTIEATDVTAGEGVSGLIGSLTNKTGGTISGGTGGFWVFINGNRKARGNKKGGGNISGGLGISIKRETEKARKINRGRGTRLMSGT